jgi:hypothetical protein
VAVGSGGHPGGPDYTPMHWLMKWSQDRWCGKPDA